MDGDLRIISTTTAMCWSTVTPHRTRSVRTASSFSGEGQVHGQSVRQSNNCVNLLQSHLNKIWLVCAQHEQFSAAALSILMFEHSATTVISPSEMMFAVQSCRRVTTAWGRLTAWCVITSSTRAVISARISTWFTTPPRAAISSARSAGACGAQNPLLFTLALLACLYMKIYPLVQFLGCYLFFYARSDKVAFGILCSVWW